MAVTAERHVTLLAKLIATFQTEEAQVRDAAVNLFESVLGRHPDL